MYLRNIIYQMQEQLKRVIGTFHKAHDKNLVSMIVGIAYARNVGLPKIAERSPMKAIQLESRVERFERLLACEKFIPLDVLKPIASQVLKSLARSGELVIVMDRSMIEAKINLLHLAVVFCGRALPLGWVRVGGKGTSKLDEQKELLQWLAECLPRHTEVYIVADREFRSIFLADFIKQMGWHFILRINSDTWVEMPKEWKKAIELAKRNKSRLFTSIKLTRNKKATKLVNLLVVWSADEEEPWLLISDLTDAQLIESIYAKRFWIEEMFSDQKRRGLNLESSRLVDPDRLERLLVAVVIAYLWIMQIGARVVDKGQWREVDNRGANRSVSLCQIGLRWLSKLLDEAIAPLLFTGRFPILSDA
jgi:hypothetical protein